MDAGRQLTWQYGQKNRDKQVEQEDVCQADPNSQPAPPIVGGLRQLMQDAIPQSLCIGWEYALCVGVPLVSLPVICNTTRQRKSAQQQETAVIQSAWSGG